MNQTDNIHSILANKTRKEMLERIAKKRIKISKIAREKNITIPAVLKHTNIMIEAELIRKNPDDYLSITDYGSSILINCRGIDFLSENMKFFETHSLRYFPNSFVERIGELSRYELVDGFVSTIEEYKKLVDMSELYAKYISAQVSLDIYKEYFPKMKRRGIKISYMLGKDSIVPRGWLDLTRKMGEKTLQKKGILNRRLLDQVHVMMFVCEKGAILAFPDHSGMVDASQMLKSHSEEFIEWCNDLYDHLWNESHIFLEEKIHET